MGLQAYLTLAAIVFCIGFFGVITRRNTIGILLGIELMLNSVNINLVAFLGAHFVRPQPPGTTRRTITTARFLRAFSSEHG